MIKLFNEWKCPIDENHHELKMDNFYKENIRLDIYHEVLRIFLVILPAQTFMRFFYFKYNTWNISDKQIEDAYEQLDNVG